MVSKTQKLKYNTDSLQYYFRYHIYLNIGHIFFNL